MDKETVSRSYRYVDDQGTVREVEITVRKDVNTRFAIKVPMYIDEKGESHNIIGKLSENRSVLQHINLTDYHFTDSKQIVEGRSMQG